MLSGVFVLVNIIANFATIPCVLDIFLPATDRLRSLGLILSFPDVSRAWRRALSAQNAPIELT
jgi:hypothetical protein